MGPAYVYRGKMFFQLLQCLENYELTNRSVAFRPIMHADRGVPPTRALSLSLSCEFISLARNVPDFLDVDRVGRRVASRQTVASMFEVDVRYKIH